ncbi:uncharacterized protein LTHEOB_1017 [Neofusicoccum parvum]|uniref:Uncharacterized protein LTHEOB_1017 n=1 Tax=Neofusicoccum parvum TaxID=310453 RepID=A0ACB5S0E7_9PEZI|nr:uncharacterized protein LTHEOB_1017 [Neofusicoccum parvum]
MYGPPTYPDQSFMSTQLTAKLPKKVLRVLMRSKSKTESHLGGRSVLLCFTTPYWYQNLPKVAEYLTTGDYAPQKPITILEVVDSNGNTLKWSPETKAISDIMDLATTDDTHLLFMGELGIYKWAGYAHYHELKEHSLLRLCTEYPVFARECLALVEFLLTMASDVELDEGMKQFLKESFARNKEKIAMQPNFTRVFEKAMGDNLLVNLLEGIQREVIVSMHARLCSNHPNPSPGTEALRRVSINSGEYHSMEEEPSIPQLDPSMAISRKVLSNLEGYISRGLLGKAKYDGFGTLLPPQKDEFGRRLRNNNFRFKQGELLLIDPSVFSFNGPKNVVVENMHGQRGDMLKELNVPWAIAAKPRTNELALPEGPVRSIAEAPTGPKALQYACNGNQSTDRSIKHEHFPSQVSEEEIPGLQGALVALLTPTVTRPYTVAAKLTSQYRAT